MIIAVCPTYAVIGWSALLSVKVGREHVPALVAGVLMVTLWTVAKQLINVMPTYA
ncbi:hypothetical protein [Pseudomonas sp. TE3610]